MKQLLHLIQFDFLLVHKNKVITISFLVTAIYVGVFKALSGLGNIEKLLVLVIFNDPALLGFLFVGVLVLFEKNENTIQALAVTPVQISQYILSKSIVLTALSLICCFGMVVAGYGLDFQGFHFAAATILTTFIFSMLGFVAVARQSTFNQYIIRALGVILFLTLPFLGYFEVVPGFWFVLFPTYPAIELYTLSFAESAQAVDILVPYTLCVVWAIISFIWARKVISKYIFQ